MRYLTRPKLAEAFQNAAKAGDKTFLLFNLLAKSGIRVSEAIRLKPKDILWEEEQLIIRGKGDKIRNVDIPGELILLLQVYMKNHKLKQNQRFFPVTRQAVSHLTKKYANCNAHAFRHTYAINLLRATQDISYVQKQLGHSSLEVTGVYLQFSDYKEAKKKLGELYI